MNTLEFEELNFKCSYPSIWNELNRKSLLRVSNLFLQKMEKHDFLLMAFFAILPTKRFMAVNGNIYFLSGRFRYFPFFSARAIRKGNKNILPINLEGFAFAKESVEFLTKELTLTKQLIPSIKVKGKMYFGLKSEIKDMTFGEYIMAETFLKDFEATNNIESLPNLCATIYKRKKFGKRLKDKNTDEFNKRAKQFESIPLNIKYAVFLYFAGCRVFFLDQFKDISSDDEDSANDRNWKDVIFELTKGSVKDSDIDDVMNARLWNVFELFRSNKKKFDDMKRSMLKSSGNQFNEFEKSMSNDK